jgi:hypothetical protein
MGWSKGKKKKRPEQNDGDLKWYVCGGVQSSLLLEG